MKKVLKILSVVLTFVLLLGVFSCATPVFAAEINEREGLEDRFQKYQTENIGTEKQVYEIEEERNQYTKVFQNSDGTKSAVISATPIHYKVDNGWEDIDNTLTKETNSNGKVYKNKKNSFVATIPEEMSSGNEIALEKEDYKISFQIEGTDIFSNNKKVKGNKRTKKALSSESDLKTDFLDKTKGITFENVGENTSVEYEVTSTGLKENIVLNKIPETEVTYRYRIKTKKLDAKLNEDNSVSFKNSDGKTVFEIPAPIMYDAQNSISHDIEVSLVGEKGKYALTYEPSYEWLTGDIAFPVVIDPVINSTSEDLGIKDAVVDDGTPNENYNNLENLITYKSDTGNVQSFVDLTRDYLVKNGAKIKTVLLGLYYTGGVFIDNSTTVAAYTVTSDWTDSSITYNNKPTTINSLIERKEITRDTPKGYMTFDVTKAYTLKEDTFGVCIRQRDSVTKEAMLNFASSEHPTVSQRPYFIIEYYETLGVEEQFDYHSFDVGRAGNVYFNDFSEQVYIERDELGLSGINMPVQIKRYFNSGMGGTNSIWYLALFGVAAPLGVGWRTNYNQLIEYHENIDGKESILYCNEQGKTIYFEKGTSDSTTGKTTWTEKPDMFSNSEGYSLQIPSQYENDISNNLQYVTIKDSKGKIHEFNLYGTLTKIYSAEEGSANCITISYADEGFYIEKITDGVGREYRFSYTEYEEWPLQLLTSIQAYTPSGSAITVTNAAGSKVPYKITYNYEFLNLLDMENIPVLSSATYPDGESVYYTVNENQISAKNIDGYTVEFNFNDESTIISEKVYAENGTDFTNGGQLTITDENSYEKSFVDLNGTKITKQFDMYGRTINVKNDNNVTNSVVRTYSDDYKAQGYISYSMYNTYEQDINGDETNLVTNGSFTTNLSGWTISDSEYVKRNANADYKKGDEKPGYLQLKCEPDEIQYAEQTIEVENGMSGDEYSLEYFVKNTTHSHMLPNLLTMDSVLVEARNNVEGNEDWTTVTWVDANPFNDNWQKYSYSFDVGFEYNEIRLIVAFYFQYGTVWYDDISLVNTYKATVNQNTDSGADDENTDSNAETEGTNTIGCDCEGCITPNCPCTNCSDSCTQPYCKRGYDFENNSEGTKFSITDGEKTMGMEQNISGNYYGSQSDLNGVYTGYSYDQMNGQLKSMSNDEGQVTNFTYDAMNRLKKVSNDVDGLTNGNKMETTYTYENDRIESITHNGFSYNYEYDVWGNPTAVKVGEQLLVSYTYDSNNQTRDRLNRITYGNGDYTDYSYNTDGNISTIKSYSPNGSLVSNYEYSYGENGQIEYITNVSENTKVKYTDDGWQFFDLSKSSENAMYSVGVNSDNKAVEKFNGIQYNELEENVSNDAVTGASTSTLSSQWGNSELNKYEFLTETDYFGRNQKEEFSFIFDSDSAYESRMGIRTEFGYKDIPSTDITEPDRTTSLVESYKTSIGGKIIIKDESLLEDEFEEAEVLLNKFEYVYEYDGNGNITKISSRDVDENNVETLTELYGYTYDNVGQLVRENNAELNKTFVYVYDKGGNVVRKVEYAYTTGDLGEAVSTINYTYDSVWKDKLTAYGNIQIQTDSMGNPLNYVNKNILGETSDGTLEWNGRQLAAAENDGGRFEYSYNSDGLRTSVRKYSISGQLEQVFYYFWQGGKLSGYIVEDEAGNVDYIIKMLYNSSGESFGYVLEDIGNVQTSTMLFEKNLQGDITGVYDSGYGLVVEYSYDAWGNVTVEYLDNSIGGMLKSVDILLYTPITYRGYMYDPYTGLYYLQSRYYNPTYGRFLNMDSIMKKGEPLGANVFAYCKNNPVNYVDYDGRDAMSVITNILYLLIVVGVMYNDCILDDFDYIFEGATSFSYVEYVNGEITDFVATFSHNSKTCYDICIKFAHIDDWRDWEIGQEHISYEGHVGQFAFDVMLSLLGFVPIKHIGTIVSVVSIVADVWSFIEDIDDQKYIDFVHDKIQVAKNNNYEYIVFVRKIDKVTTNSIGISKSETIYDCIEG